MFFRTRKRRKRRASKDAKIVNWIIIVIVAMAFLQNLGKRSEPLSLEHTADSLKEKGLAEVADYKKKVFPDPIPVFHIEDVEPGEGNPVICGQKVAIVYKAFKDDQPIDDSADKDNPLVFQIGEHKAMPAFEQGVLGMKQGGKRTIFAPMPMSYGIKEFARADVEEKSKIRFEVELLDAKPELPDMNSIPFRVVMEKSGSGQGLGCGATAKLQLTVWSAAGKKIFSTSDKEPIAFTLGNSEAFLGLEQGVMGIKAGEMRTLIVPPVLQKTLSGKPAAIIISLPKNETVLVDVEAVP